MRDLFDWIVENLFTLAWFSEAKPISFRPFFQVICEEKDDFLTFKQRRISCLFRLSFSRVFLDPLPMVQSGLTGTHLEKVIYGPRLLNNVKQLRPNHLPVQEGLQKRATRSRRLNQIPQQTKGSPNHPGAPQQTQNPCGNWQNCEEQEKHLPPESPATRRGNQGKLEKGPQGRTGEGRGK